MKKLSTLFRKKPRNDGKELEERVAKLCRNMGYWPVRKNVRVFDKHGNMSEFDVCCGTFSKYYFECKQYTNHTVPLSDVAKFKSVLELNNINLNRGIFVTTSDYVPRALEIGIRTVNGTQLNVLEKNAKNYLLKRVILAILLVVLGGIAGSYYYWPQTFHQQTHKFKQYIKTCKQNWGL